MKPLTRSHSEVPSTLDFGVFLFVILIPLGGAGISSSLDVYSSGNMSFPVFELSDLGIGGYGPEISINSQVNLKLTNLNPDDINLTEVKYHITLVCSIYLDTYWHLLEQILLEFHSSPQPLLSRQKSDFQWQRAS